MSLQNHCIPRPSVFASDRRATVLSLDRFLRGDINGAGFFDENYFTTGMQTLIDRAFLLVPGGLETTWLDLSKVERYYLRARDIESRGERRKGMYEELARGFGVTDIKPLLKSDKANTAGETPESGRQYLRDTFGITYWPRRERLIRLLEWLAALANAEGMADWKKNSQAAHLLAGRLRNDEA